MQMFRYVCGTQGFEEDVATNRTPVSKRRDGWLPDAEVPVELPSLDKMIEDAGMPPIHLSTRLHIR